MSVTMYFYKHATAELVDSEEYFRKFYRFNLENPDTIELSYSLRNDFCSIYRDVIGVEFPTKEESYDTREAAMACVVSPAEILVNIDRIVKETDTLRQTNIPDLDVAYISDLFKQVVKKCALGYFVMIDYA